MFAGALYVRMSKRVHLITPTSSPRIRKMANDIDFLAQVPLFSRFEREALEALSKHLQHHTVEAGEEIIKEGDRDRRLFVIVHGRVEVIKGRGGGTKRRLATFGPLDYFGEMALIDDLFRSATVVARDKTELLSLDHWDLREEIGKHPSLAIELLKMLSQRVRALEKMVMTTLGGLVPICANCKNIREEGGTWVRIEEYIADRSDTDFTHGICPDCLRKLYPEHCKDEH
jgi:CRP-like cAMP-binding protein